MVVYRLRALRASGLSRSIGEDEHVGASSSLRPSSSLRRIQDAVRVDLALKASSEAASGAGEHRVSAVQGVRSEAANPA